MLKALTVRELSKAISSAKAMEYAVVADAARVALNEARPWDGESVERAVKLTLEALP